MKEEATGTMGVKRRPVLKERWKDSAGNGRMNEIRGVTSKRDCDGLKSGRRRGYEGDNGSWCLQCPNAKCTNSD